MKYEDMKLLYNNNGYVSYGSVCRSAIDEWYDRNLRNYDYKKIIEELEQACAEREKQRKISEIKNSGTKYET